MLNAIELRWKRCPDGYRIEEPSPDEILAHERRAATAGGQTIFGGGIEPGPRIVPVSEAVEDFRIMDELESEGSDPLLAFVNVSGDEEILSFANRLGRLVGPSAMLTGSEEDRRAHWLRGWIEGERKEDWLRRQKSVKRAIGALLASDYDEVVRLYEENRLGTATMKLVNTKLGPRPKMWMEPASLLSLIWLHLGYRASGETIVRACRVCGKFMTLGGSARGYKNKETCSNRCRVALHRQKARERVNVLPDTEGAGT